MKVEVDLNYSDVIIQRVENGWILKTVMCRDIGYFDSKEVDDKDYDYLATEVFEDPDILFEDENVTKAKSLVGCFWNAFQMYFRSKHSPGIEIHVEEKSRYDEEIEREIEEDGEEET